RGAQPERRPRTAPLAPPVHGAEAAFPREAGDERRRTAAELLRRGGGFRGSTPGLRRDELQRSVPMRALATWRRSSLAAALAALALAAPAAGAVRITGLDTSAYPHVSLSVVTSTPTRAAPSLREDDRLVVGPEAVNLGRAKHVGLAVDDPRSM